MTLRIKTVLGGHKLPDKVYHAKKLAQIRARCTVDESGCWLWQGFVTWNGYGGTNYRGKNWRVHRVAYVCAKGPIPDGHDVCHTCDVRTCCNPQHLWTGTRGENNRDTRNKGRDNNSQKTHCPHGHAYSEWGYIVKAGYKGFRHCRMCERIRGRLKAGWTLQEAMSLPAIPPGQRTTRRDFGNKQSFQVGKDGDR